MRVRLFSIAFEAAAAAACLLTAVANAQSQSTASTGPPETEVVITKLSSPVYSPLMRMANITGEVKLQLGIRPDGSVASAEVVSGHPMLKEAALESAKGSAFECRKCTDGVTSYRLTYTFEIWDDGDC